MIQVIERFHTILTRVADNDGRPCTVKELAALLEVSPPTCSNILRAMCDLGWLVPADGVRGYLLGPTLYQLAKGGDYRQDVIELASPILQALCRELNESVTLVTNQNGKRHCLMELAPERDIVLKSTDTNDHDLYRHTTGLTLLAFMSRHQREAYYKTVGSPVGESMVPVKSLNDFETLCETIRKKGYLKTEYITADQDKITVVAFPVQTADSCPLAIGIQIPSFRFSRTKMSETKAAVTSAANRISSKLA